MSIRSKCKAKYKTRICIVFIIEAPLSKLLIEVARRLLPRFGTMHDMMMDDIIDFLCRIFLFLYNNCLLVLLISEVIGKLYKMNRLINGIIKEGY